MVKKQLFVLIVFLNFSWGFSQDTKFTSEITQISGGGEFNITLQEAIRNGNVDMFRSLDQSSPSLPPPSSPKAITTFDGITFDENASNAGFYSIPPDPSGTAGPGHLVSVVNTSIEWFTKAGVQENSQRLGKNSTTHVGSFFESLTPTTGTFDPKVIYDQYADRFVVVTLERVGTIDDDAGNISRILLAVSADSDPNGTWYFHAIDSKLTIGSTDSWADYPGFAVDEEAVYVTANMFRFSGGSSLDSRVWIIDKGLIGGFYDGGAASVVVYAQGTEAGLGTVPTTQPAHMFGSPSSSTLGTFLVSSGWSGGSTDYLSVILIDDPLGTITFTNTFVSLGDLFSTSTFTDAPQMGTTTLIETNDLRALQAVWRNDTLWVVNCIIPPSGTDAGQVTAHWYKIETVGTISLSDQGNIGGETIATGCYTFFPSIAVNSTNDICIGFSASASTIYPGCYFTGRLSTDAAGFTRTPDVVRAGLDFYIRIFPSSGGTRNRWGDYSGTCVDPFDDQTFYVFNEYALMQGTDLGDSELGRWGTAFGKVPSSRVWINEISYQMTGGDNDDFIEIIAPVNTDMSSYGILLANGADDASLDYIQLSGTVSNTNSNNGFGFFVLLTDESGDVVVPASVTSQSSGFGSIQNGSPDGVLLLNHTTAATVHGIWYEESGTAPTEITRDLGAPPGTGPYSMSGVDVTSLSDGSSTASGGSISMYGSGNSGTWEVTLIGTPGDINTNQTDLPVELTSFSAVIVGSKIKLNWRTETEVNNYGFEVERTPLSPPFIKGGKQGDWELIGFVDGHGNTNSPKEYSFIDDNVLSGKYSYRLKQIDNDGTFEYSKTIEVDMDAPIGYGLSQNYPNPFNPSTTITFTLPVNEIVSLNVYNMLGEEIQILQKGFLEAGMYSYNFNAESAEGGLPSGVYFYKLETPTKILHRKMLLIK